MRPASAATVLRHARYEAEGSGERGGSFSAVTRLVVGLAVLLQGCAGLVGGREPVAGPVQTLGEAGRFQISKGRSGIVIGAPEGVAATGTDRIGRDLARLTGFGAVVATRPSRRGGDQPLDRDHGGGDDPGPAALLEGQTVDAAYRRHVGEAAQGPLDLYVEVRGDGHAERAGRVEIATLGLSREEAWGLKTLFELIRDARVDARGAPRLEVWVEPADSRPVTASAAPPSGRGARPDPPPAPTADRGTRRGARRRSPPR